MTNKTILFVAKIFSSVKLMSTAPVPQEWLAAAKGKGLEVWGTFARRNGQIFADMSFTNKALAPMGDFAIQFNKNRFVTKSVPLSSSF